MLWDESVKHVEDLINNGELKLLTVRKVYCIDIQITKLHTKISLMGRINDGKYKNIGRFPYVHILCSPGNLWQHFSLAGPAQALSGAHTLLWSESVLGMT